MSFYTHQPNHYCGLALQARSLSVCILAQAGTILVQKNRPATPAAFVGVVAPCRADLVVAGEGLCTWDGLSALGARAGSAFGLGPALDRTARPDGKAKHDKRDTPQSAGLRRGGRRPLP